MVLVREPHYVTTLATYVRRAFSKKFNSYSLIVEWYSAARFDDCRQMINA